MDTREERILEYALDGISRDLMTLERTVGKEHISYQDLHEFYLETYDEYIQAIRMNIL